MQPYLDLLRRIRTEGTRKKSRAELKSTGTKPDTLSMFGPQMTFDLSAGFPLVTTKFLPVDGIVYELLWFLRGDTNIKYLRDHKVTFWDEWADAAGNLGPVYGKQWRSWAAPDGSTIDQIAQRSEEHTSELQSHSF